MKITIKKPSTLIEFLQEFFPGSPRTRIKKLLQSGNILINNKPVTLHSHPLKPGDTVDVIKASRPVVSSGSPFTVLYEDECLIAIDKPAGIATSSVDGSRNTRDEMSAFLRDNSKGKFRAWLYTGWIKKFQGFFSLQRMKKLWRK